MVDVIVNPAPPAPMAAPAASERAQARRETLRLLLRRPAFIIGNIIIIGWIICAVLGQRITPYDPFNDFSAGHLPPSPEHWFGTDRIGRDVLSRVMVGLARRADRRPAGGPARGDRGHVPRPDHGLLPGPDRRRPEPPRRGVPRPAGHPRRAADAGRARHVAARRRLRRRDPVHADRRADGPLGGAVGAGARLRHGGQAPRRVRARSSCRARSSRTSSGRPSSR